VARVLATFAINPSTTTFDGDPGYPDLRSLPESVDGMVIIIPPATTEQIVHQCGDTAR
jgi:hypothetical protein